MLMDAKQSALLLIGLPGSGKTHYIKNYLHHWVPACGKFEIFDDPLTYNDVEAMEEVVKSRRSIVISDPYLCNKTIEDAAFCKLKNWQSNIVINKVYFENNLDACVHNIAYRLEQGDTRKVLGFAKYLSKFYNPPSDALPVIKASV